jgi:fermentation-respiration switch protein FrsA (DUF1100 family)
VILESPYTSFSGVIRRIVPLPVEAVLLDNYDSHAKIGRLSAPLLVTVGSADTLIPPGDSQALFEKAPDPKAFFTVEGAGHNDIQVLGGEAYWERLRTWLEERTPPAGR